MKALKVIKCLIIFFLIIHHAEPKRPSWSNPVANCTIKLEHSSNFADGYFRVNGVRVVNHFKSFRKPRHYECWVAGKLMSYCDMIDPNYVVKFDAGSVLKEIYEATSIINAARRDIVNDLTSDGLNSEEGRFWSERFLNFYSPPLHEVHLKKNAQFDFRKTYNKGDFDFSAN